MSSEFSVVVLNSFNHVNSSLSKYTIGEARHSKTVGFYTAQRATDVYHKECTKWDEAYGEKATPKGETMHEKIQRYKEKADRQNTSQLYRMAR